MLTVSKRTLGDALLDMEVTASRGGTKVQDKTWRPPRGGAYEPRPIRATAALRQPTLLPGSGSGRSDSALPPARNLASETVGVGGDLNNDPIRGLF